MIKLADKNQLRARRQKRVRGKISGSPEIPRLNVYRSSKHIYAQLIDDVNGVTLASASTRAKGFEADGTKVACATAVGQALAAAAVAKGIKQIVFDRAGYLYTGRIKALADAAREGGLVF